MLAFRRALLAAPSSTHDDFFVFVHAAGGWDVTLWSDPRNERKGIVEPASTANSEVGPIRHWKSVPLDGRVKTFEVVTPPGSSLRLGPAIGDLFDLHDRITILNGIAMNTVSHDDGTVFSATGRHKSGGSVPAPSIDVMLASELGTTQLMPDVSVGFPSYFVGPALDQRAIPLRVSTVDTITKSLERSQAFLDTADRDAISAVLAEEGDALATRSGASDPIAQLVGQQREMPKLLQPEFVSAFTTRTLQKAYPQFKFGVRDGHAAQGAAFAVEAFRRNVARCVSYSVGGLDTHNTNYREHAKTLQDLFDSIAALVKVLDETPHPTLSATRLSERTHIVVISEFCRTPMINLIGGRDHYPNNSALVISPRFKRGRSFGATDAEQVLPTPFKTFADGSRAIAPPDVLATVLGAFGIDPRKYMRDGEIVRELLA